MKECAPLNSITQVQKGGFYQKWFYIPAEYDVYVYFNPISNSERSPWDDSNEGKFILKAKYLRSIKWLGVYDWNPYYFFERDYTPEISDKCLDETSEIIIDNIETE